MRNDPSDNGGLFVGRRPGTAPIHFRALPKRGSSARQRVDRCLAGVMLATMTMLSVLCWGPIPLACLWIGAQINYLTGSISLGILSAFVGLFVLLFGALRVMRGLDEAWILVRRAAGFDQRAGVLGRVFAITAVVCANRVRAVVRADQRDGQHGRPRQRSLSRCPESEVRRRPPVPGRPRYIVQGAMGLLDYYRQFEGLSEEEVNIGLREEAAERRRKALTRVRTIDLSQTTWPELPHPNIANSITYIARRGLQLYPHLRGSELRDELAERHGVDPTRLILGNGAASS